MGETAENWAAWLAAQLEKRNWKQADLVRASGNLVKRDRASKWLSGKEAPSYRNAVMTANILRVNPAEALEAAGYLPGTRISDPIDVAFYKQEQLVAEFSRKLQVQVALFRELRLTDFSEVELAAELLRRAEGRAVDAADAAAGVRVGGAEQDDLHAADLSQDELDLAATTDDTAVDPNEHEA